MNLPLQKTLVVLSLLLCMKHAHAQQQVFLGLQTDIGFGFTKTSQHNTILKSKSIPWQFNTKISLQYRLWNSFSMEAGIGNNNFIWKIKDVDFNKRYNSDFDANMANKIGHLSYFFNLQYAVPINKYQFAYIQFGGGYHQYGQKTLTQTKDFVYGGQTAETVSMTTSYNQGSYYIQPEIGFQQFLNSSFFSVGLLGAFNISNNLFTSNYTATKPNGTLLSSDKLTESGSYAGINLRFNISLMDKARKEKTAQKKTPELQKPKTAKPQVVPQKKPTEKIVEKEKTEPPKNTKPPVIPTDKPKDPVVEKKKPDPVPTTKKSEAVDVKKIAPEKAKDSISNGRPYTITHALEVNSNKVQLKIWDDKIEDGDKVNISLNGNWILKEYVLQRAPKIIEITLTEGINEIVLYALNLGDRPPNTAALAVFDGEKWKQIVLESTLEKSGALQLKYTPNR